MIELHTLGGFAVRDRTSAEPRILSVAPRQAALLVRLVLSRPARVSRDRLARLFWPELPEDRSRAALRQALYRLRVELGRDVVMAHRETHVEVLQDRVRCDATLFERACAEERLEAALELYEGDLLIGFHVSDAPEFDHWLDAERERFRQRAVAAATMLAHRTEAAANPGAAVQWLRRALELAPYEEPLIREQVRLMFAAGDRSGAIRAYDRFVARLARDLDLEPSAALQEVVALLRTTEPPIAEVVIPQEADDGAERGATSSGEDVVRAAVAPSVEPRSARTRWYEITARRAAIAIGGLGALGAVLFQFSGASTSNSAHHREQSARRVIVMPFDNGTGDAALNVLGPMASDWITQAVQRTGLVEVIDATAAARLTIGLRQESADGLAGPALEQLVRRTNAGTLISGSFTRQGASLVVRVRIADTRDGTVLRTLDPVFAPVHDAARALNEVQARVAGALAAMLDARFASIGTSSSAPPTFAAYQEFIEGIDDFIGNDPRGAIQHFERAARLDPTFIMARLWIAHVANVHQYGRRDSLVLSMVPDQDRLAPAERAGLDMFVAGLSSDWEAMLRAARRAAKLAPQSIWAQSAGFLAIRLGRPREALTDLDAYGPDGGWLSNWQMMWNHRMIALHQLGEYEEELATARRGASIWRSDRRPPWGPDVFHMHEFFALASLGRLDELDQRADALADDHFARGWTGNGGDIYLWVGRELWGHGRTEHAAQYFEKCGELTGNPECLLLSGRYREADAYYAARAHLPGNPHDDWIASRVAARLGRRADAERLAARMASRPWPEDRMRFQQASIAALLGDRLRAVAILREEPLRGQLFEWLHTSPDFQDLRDDPFIRPLVLPAR